MREFAHYKIVTPAWIVDSIAAQKLLPWERFKWRPLQLAAEGSSQAIPQKSILSFAKPSAKGEGRVLPEDVKTDLSDSGSDSSRPVKRQRIVPPSPFVVPTTSTSVASHSKGDTTASTVMDVEPPMESHYDTYGYGESNLQAQRLMQDENWRAQNTSAAGEAFLTNYHQRSRSIELLPRSLCQC